MPSFALAMTLAASRGAERQYCWGAWTCAPRIAAACQGQRGFQSIARAIATRSASPDATIASAYFASVMSPTAIVGIDVARRIARASGT